MENRKVTLTHFEQGSPCLILLLLFSPVSHIFLLKKAVQENLSRVYFEGVMQEARIIGLLLWLRGHKLRVVLFVYPVGTPHMHPDIDIINYLLLWIDKKDEHTGQKSCNSLHYPQRQ